MDFFTKKSVVQKIIFVIVILLLVNFALAPYASYAADDWDRGGKLAKPLFQFLCWIGDVIMGGLNRFMLGANTGVGGMGSAMLDQDDANLDDDNSWLNPANYEDAIEIPKFENNEIDTKIFFAALREDKYAVPNMLYCPENIFAGNIAALDINFIHPNTYSSVYGGGESDFEKDANQKKESATTILSQHVSNWYKAFRNISVVALLSILIYLGIRILISSTAADKAKHKEALQSWFIALCLVFFIHIIMSGILMITDTCTELFKANVERGYTVTVDGNKPFHTNLMGLVRFRAQSTSAVTAATYTIMYLALVIYTIMFTFIYLKRFFYMAFFTMIAPLVSLTYPLDKIGDGKSQAFNMWFKEYTMNAIIQPVHLILYSLFVGAAADLAAENPLYALVALAFLTPAEQFIKKMFGLEAQTTSGGMGAFAGGALAMAGLNQLSKLGSGGKKGPGIGGSKDGEGSASTKKPRFIGDDKSGNFNAFGGDSKKHEATDGSEDKDEGGQNPLNKMLEADDEKFGTDDWDAQQRNALAEEANINNDGAMQYSDDEYRQILQDSGYSDEEINDMMGDVPALNNEEGTIGENTQNQANNSGVGSIADANGMERPKQKIKGYRKRIAGRAAKAVWKRRKGIARATLGTAARLAGAAAGASIGLAAGITTGDLSKTATNMVAGAAAGNIIGANAYRAGEGIATGIPRGTRTISNARDNARTAIDEEMYGITYARQEQRRRQNEKARKEFLKDDEEKQKYRELAAKMEYKGNLSNLMNAAADYKEAGITDDKLIHNALQAEYKRGNKTLDGKTHEQFMDVAAFAQDSGYGKDYIDDEKKRASLENAIQYNPALANNPRAQREVAQTFAEIFDRGDVYRKVGKLGKPTTPRTNKK